MISGCGVGERVVTLVNLNAGGKDIRFAVLKNRNFRAIFDIKVDRRYGVEASERLANRSSQYLPDGLFVLKFDFCFGRMDIDVNTTGIDEDLQKERYLFAVGNEAFVGTLYRFCEIRVSHEATIGKKELLRTFLFAAFGIAHEANDLNQVRFYMNRHEIFVHLAPENIDDALRKQILIPMREWRGQMTIPDVQVRCVQTQQRC